MSTSLFRIEFYVPESHLDVVKNAMFQSGAGRVGNYDCCAWQTPGSGQFRPGADSAPFIGSVGEIETVREYKVELVCQEDCLGAALAAMKQAHPYEEPAYAVIGLHTR